MPVSMWRGRWGPPATGTWTRAARQVAARPPWSSSTAPAGAAGGRTTPGPQRGACTPRHEVPSTVASDASAVAPPAAAAANATQRRARDGFRVEVAVHHYQQQAPTPLVMSQGTSGPKGAAARLRASPCQTRCAVGTFLHAHNCEPFQIHNAQSINFA